MVTGDLKSKPKQTLVLLSNQGCKVMLRGGPDIGPDVTPDLSRILCGWVSALLAVALQRGSQGDGREREREKDKGNRQIKGHPGILPGVAPAV